MNPLTEAAIALLANDHRLLALTGKRPNSRYHAKPADSDEPGWSWEKSIHGEVTTDADRAALDAIFSDPSTTGIAILIPKGALVADVDTRAAADLFVELVGARTPPRTTMAKTPNGFHIWYLWPEADSSTWLGNRTLLFKGFGGYVAAPPSAHFNSEGAQDGVYQWVYTEPIAPLPPKIATALADARALAALTPVRFSEESDAEHMHLEWDERGHLVAMWPEWRIDGLLKAVREADEGNRNNMLAWAALTAAEEGCTLQAVMSPLLEAALAAGLTRRESQTTIRAAFKRRSRG